MRWPNSDAPLWHTPAAGLRHTGVPLRPHRRPPRACGGPQQRHPSGSPLAGLRRTPSGALLRPHRRPPRACGGPNCDTHLWHFPSARLWHIPPAHPSAHIGGLPGHAAASIATPPLAHPLGRAMAHPSQSMRRPNSDAHLWHTPTAGLRHTRPAYPSSHIGGVPGHAAVSNSGAPTGTPLRQPQSGAPPCAQIGGLPGHVAAPQNPPAPTPARLARANAHPSGAPLRRHRPDLARGRSRFPGGVY